VSFDRRRLLDLLVHGARLRRLAQALQAEAHRWPERGRLASLAGELDAARAQLRMDLFGDMPEGETTAAFVLEAGAAAGVALPCAAVTETLGPRADLLAHVGARLGSAVPWLDLARFLDPTVAGVDPDEPLVGLLLQDAGHQALLLVEDLPRRHSVVAAPLGQLLFGHPLVHGVALDPGGTMLPLVAAAPLIAAARARDS